MKDEKQKSVQIGLVSMIIGIVGLIFYFIGWLFFSFMDNRLIGMGIGFILGIVAVVIGYFAQKQGDRYGSYGMVLGGAILIIGVITMILTTPVSVETGYYS